VEGVLSSLQALIRGKYPVQGRAAVSTYSRPVIIPKWEREIYKAGYREIFLPSKAK
jgi:hypothetical protein